LVIAQSNHEGVLIDLPACEHRQGDGAIINPAGITHYGVPLHDAIAAMPFPVIEVHLSNLAARESAPSLDDRAGPRSFDQGLGWHSYTTALRAVAKSRREKSKG